MNLSTITRWKSRVYSVSNLILPEHLLTGVENRVDFIFILTKSELRFFGLKPISLIHKKSVDSC